MATTFHEALAGLETARGSLRDELARQEWGSANTSLRRLYNALAELGVHIDATVDDGRHDELVTAYNAAVDEHNAAVDTLHSAGELEGCRIGDTRPCGCPVEAVSVPCPPHEREWGQAMTDCSACEFGVPGVRHWNYGCEDPK